MHAVVEIHRRPLIGQFLDAPVVGIVPGLADGFVGIGVAQFPQPVLEVPGILEVRVLNEVAGGDRTSIPLPRCRQFPQEARRFRMIAAFCGRSSPRRRLPRALPLRGAALGPAPRG